MGIILAARCPSSTPSGRSQSVMAADAGTPSMQEIAAAVREGAQAYLRRQYTTIGIVGVVIFVIVAYFLGCAGRARLR